MKWIYKNEIIPIIVIIIILTIVGLFSRENRVQTFKSKGIITNAFVTSHKYDYKGRLEIEFRFLINDSVVLGQTAFPELKTGSEKFILGKHFPVIFARDDYSKNELLASGLKFRNLSLIIPDSLKWLEKLEIPW